MINYILEKEWEFIDGNIEKNDYIKFLWYSWYVNQEEQLLHASTESAKYLIETDIEMEFYWILHLFLGFEASYEKIKEQIEVFEKQASLFDKAERNILLSIIMRKIESFRKEFLEEAILNQKNVSFRKMVQVICLSKNKKIMDELQEETIELALFENNLSNMIKKYIQIKGFSAKGQGPVYVTVEQLREINQTAKPFWVRSIPYSEQRINQGMEVAATTNFVWPSTEIKGKGNQEVESNGLNNESELKRLGYQITGMTRVKRWIILEKAVQELGLKKVAYTIAHHVKLRKGQKDGQRKFSYSITEWEYDLHKLKQTYYKNDFVWPKTNN